MLISSRSGSAFVSCRNRTCTSAETICLTSVRGFSAPRGPCVAGFRLPAGEWCLVVLAHRPACFRGRGSPPAFLPNVAAGGDFRSRSSFASTRAGFRPAGAIALRQSSSFKGSLGPVDQHVDVHVRRTWRRGLFSFGFDATMLTIGALRWPQTEKPPHQAGDPRVSSAGSSCRCRSCTGCRLVRRRGKP